MVKWALLLLICLVTLAWGQIPLQDAWNTFSDFSIWNPLRDERLPRLIVLLTTGASLAVSGAVMQSLFQNPLAAPSVLGITFGGSLAVVAIFVLGWHQIYPMSVPLGATCGCLAALMAVYLLSKRGGELQFSALILNGIALSTLLMATQKVILYALKDHWHLIQAVTEWEAGSSANRSWLHVHMQLPMAIVGIAGCLKYARELNLLALGEEEALSLGVEVERVRWRLFLCVALLTGGALAGLGSLAFFGLILPHLLRRLVGPNMPRLLPLTLIWGAILLAGMDLSLRVLDLHLFSIGNVSALLGGVLFLILLTDERQRLCYA